MLNGKWLLENKSELSIAWKVEKHLKVDIPRYATWQNTTRRFGGSTNHGRCQDRNDKSAYSRELHSEVWWSLVKL